MRKLGKDYWKQVVSNSRNPPCLLDVEMARKNRKLPIDEYFNEWHWPFGHSPIKPLADYFVVVNG
jgi:hypothetical protein